MEDGETEEAQRDAITARMRAGRGVDWPSTVSATKRRIRGYSVQRSKVLASTIFTVLIGVVSSYVLHGGQDILAPVCACFDAESMSVSLLSTVLFGVGSTADSPPNPWERSRAEGASGPAPFKPPSAGSTSDVVEASGTAKPDENVTVTESLHRSYHDGLEVRIECLSHHLKKVVLRGPTSFATLIYAAIFVVQNSNCHYHVLMIVAGGHVTHVWELGDFITSSEAHPGGFLFTKFASSSQTLFDLFPDSFGGRMKPYLQIGSSSWKQLARQVDLSARQVLGQLRHQLVIELPEACRRAAAAWRLQCQGRWCSGMTATIKLMQNEYFFRYRDDRNAAEIFRANGDINGLKSHCNSQ
ncbi:Peroxisomal membrane protein 13, partial [Zea mays]